MPFQQPISGLWGFLPPTPASMGSTAINSSTTYVSFQFVAQSTDPLSAFRFRCTGKSGTGGTIVCKVYADLNGAPDLSTVIDTLTVGTLTANTWISCTGGTVGLTTGTSYWVALSNTDGTPASNNISVTFFSALTGPINSHYVATSTNGTTWTLRSGGGGCRFDFGSNYYGLPVQTATASSGSTQVFGSNELGVRLVTPANVKLVVAGICGFMNTVTGTPTGNPYFNLRDSSHNLIGSTQQISNGAARNQTNIWYSRLFTGGSTYTIDPSSTISITLAESTQSDTSANAFSLRQYVVDSDANSLALIPWSMVQDFYNGSTWAQTTGTILSLGLILANGSEFGSIGGGGGRLVGSSIVQSGGLLAL